jgi:hypothetical protein
MTTFLLLFIALLQVNIESFYIRQFNSILHRSNQNDYQIKSKISNGVNDDQLIPESIQLIDDENLKMRTKDLNSSYKKFYIETHGCQMNLADSDVVRSVLLDSKYISCDQLEEADLILINTCAIRENAETKIWQRLKYFNSLRKRKKRFMNRNILP